MKIIFKRAIKFRMMVSILLIVTMIATQINVCLAYNVVEDKYLAIQANKYNLSKNVEINGNILQGGIEDYSSAIFYLLSGEDTVIDAISTENDYTVDKPIYCNNKVNINANSLVNNAILASDVNININSKSVTSDETAMIFSNSGDFIE